MKQEAKYPFSIFISNSWSNKKLPFDEDDSLGTQNSYYPGTPCIFKIINKRHEIRSKVSFQQKYTRLRCLLRVKGLVICFYLG